ncbi:MAG: biotin transporter BioY [Deltaproteobacteria bacterium]|nr:biotin transporter BioY [Deltaproteobacteria bacterium]
MPIEKLRMIVLASLMAALMAVGAYIHIPIGPVPIVLTNLFVLLSGLLLGSRWGLASVGLYLLVGAIGMPVFYGGKGGFAHILGPTGGYLFGFAFSAWMTGFISERFRHSLIGGIIGVIIGSLAVYCFGVPWLKTITKMSWNKAWMVGMLPFLLGDALKAAVAIVLARAVRPMLNRQTQTASTLTPTLSHRREREREQ